MSLISVIMPYYKKKLFVKKSLESVLNQSYQNLEIILINDEVENKNNIFLNEICKLDNRIKLITNDKNLGAGESRNRAIKIAKGEYIAFCDCDDLWKDTKLEVQIEFMKKFKLNFSYTSYEIIDKNNKKIAFRKADNFVNFNKLRNSCDIGLSTVMMARKIFENDQYRFAKLKTKEDYVLWMLLAKNEVKMLGINENLVSWRKSSNSLSSSTFQKLKDGYKVYRVYLGYSRFKSLFYLIVLSINFLLKN